MINDGNQRREQCQNQAKQCQSKFAVPTLSSHEWLLQQERSDASWVIVDVRTAPECRVSMIRGAKTLAEFDRDWRAGTIPHHTKVAFYCTIGYRSGIHANKYLRRHTEDLEGRVFNLDGIVAFSQAVTDRLTHNSAMDNPRDWLIDPHSGEPTNCVHTFGALWNFVDTEIFVGICYSRSALLVRMMQVGFIASGHHAREGLYFLKRIASRRKRRHKQS
jgi:rhodanese-related sulfurtransferase